MSSNVVKVSGNYKIKAAQGGTITLDVGLNGTVDITGNLNVTGEVTAISSTITELTDNIIILNNGENSNKISLTESGIEIDRGSNTNGNAQLFFVEDIEWPDPVSDTTKSGLFVVKTKNTGISAIQTSAIYTGGNDLYLIASSGTGVVSVFGTTNYANNVTQDHHIPNKKYVDDRIANNSGGKVTITQPNNSATLTILNNKTFTVNNTLTLSGTDGTTVAFGAGLSIASSKSLTVNNTITLNANDGITASFGAGGTVAYTGGNLSQFASTTSSQLKDVISDETGTGGKLMFNYSPVIDGYPTFYGQPTTGLTGTGKMMLNNSPEILGTPKFLTVTITGTTGTGNMVFSSSPSLATPTFTGNVAFNAGTGNNVTMTGTSGTGKLVFNASPSFTTPTLGVATATSINGISITSRTASSLNIYEGKNLIFESSIDFISNDGAVVNFNSGGDVAYQTDLANYVLSTSLSGTINDFTLNDSTSSDTAKSIGFLGTPINTKSAGYILAISDQGKTIYTSAAITIPANSSVAFPIGTEIKIIASDAISVDIASDTLQWGGQATNQTGTRNIAKYGMATLVKVTSTIWYITGVGLT